MTRHTLVTGGAGFIGSHLTEALLARGDQVTVVDDLSTGDQANLAAVANHQRYQFIQEDIAELADRHVERADEVYHLAAAVGVKLICSQTYQSIERNVWPTCRLLGALREKIKLGGTVKFFLASSSEVYGNNASANWTENETPVFGPSSEPRWSYGVSKLVDEFLALAAWREFQVPVVIGRFFNVVGPRQTGNYGMVLPRFVKAAVAGQPLTVHDDGQQTRCFAHVQDVVGAVVALMQSPAAIGQVFNIGSDIPVTILDLAQMVAAAVEPHAEIQFQSYQAVYGNEFQDVRRRVPDTTRLRNTIHYELTKGLPEIVHQLINETQTRA